MAKAIAGASGVPFLFATGSGFANMFMGIGNLKVRKLFKKGSRDVGQVRRRPSSSSTRSTRWALGAR